MNTCSTCIHWRLVDPNKRGGRMPDATVKNCTALPPRADFHWPRTSEEQTCGMHDGRVTVIFDGKMSPELAESLKAMPPGVILPHAVSPVQAQVADLLSQVEPPATAAPRSRRRNG